MKKKWEKHKKERWPSITEVVKETLEDVNKVVDNSDTIEEFNKLQSDEKMKIKKG